jgi:hypothetical protein
MVMVITMAGVSVFDRLAIIRLKVRGRQEEKREEGQRN